MRNRAHEIGLGQGICERGTGVDLGVNEDAERTNNAEISQSRKPVINCMIVPTGIGASIGGYAGDANPVARQLAAVSDILITHPNVVNGAMFTDIPNNVFVLEGALLDMFFLGQLSFSPVRVNHKIAIVIDKAAPLVQREITTNAINAAKYFYGLDIITKPFYTEEPVGATLSEITNPDTLVAAARKAIDSGATALALVCLLPEGDSSQYYQGRGIDPIGLIEAKISHLVSGTLMIPSAHAPVFKKVFEHQGVVHPRVAAEHLGLSYLPSVFKCLAAMPNVALSLGAVTSSLRAEPSSLRGTPCRSNLHAANQWLTARNHEFIHARDIKRLIVPYDSCNGVPMQNAERFGIELITIYENSTALTETAIKLGLKHSECRSYADCVSDIASADTRHCEER